MPEWLGVIVGLLVFVGFVYFVKRQMEKNKAKKFDKGPGSGTGSSRPGTRRPR